MLQRQIIFKQLQELQRKQQVQELGDARNQHYIDQLSSMGDQLPSAVIGMPVQNSSQMLMVGKLQMMQGMNNESEIVPSHNHSMIQVGLPHPQFDVSLCGASTPNTDKISDLYSHLQGPPDHSANLSTKNNNGALEMPSMQPSGFGNTLLNKQSDLYSDQISMPNESLLSNQGPVQGFSCGILYGNYSHQGMTAQRSALPLEYEARQENEGWHELPLRKALKPAPSDLDASLDPLEQKFLYSTDDNIWGSSFSRSIDNGLETFASNALEHTSYIDRFPTMQSGSWSALMQSAVAETSSDDGGLQEEWSGLNFQNSELLTDNQTSNYIDIVKQKNNWVDTDLQNSSPLSAKTETVPDDSNINGSSSGFQQSDHQYLRQKEEFHSESSDVSNQHFHKNTSQYNCQQKHPTGCNKLFQDHELRGAIWPHGNTPREIQKPFDQIDHQIMADQLNMHGYSIESEKISSGMNDEPIQVLRASSDVYSQSVIYEASNTMLDLLNKDSTSINHAPGMQLSAKISAHNESLRTETTVAACAKPCNDSPISLDQRTLQSSLAMGNLCSTYPSSHNVNNRFENQHSRASPKPTDLATDGLVYSSDGSMLKNANFISSEVPILKHQQVTQAAVTSVSPQHVGFPTGLVSQLVDVTTQPYALSPKPKKSPNFFCSLNSENSSLETSLVLPNEQSSINSSRQKYNAQGFCGSSRKPEYRERQLVAESFLQKGSTEIINSISVSRYNHDQDLYRENHFEANAVASSSLMMTQSHQPSDKLESPYQSQISLQLAQYISKHDGTVKNGQLFPIHHPEVGSNTVKRFSGTAIVSSMLPSIAATFIASEQSSPSKLPSYATCQNMAVSKPKKRKVAFDMVPWHKEVKCDSFMLQNIGVAELEWAEASNRRVEEVINEAEILEDMQPRFRAKRRLVFATQLMQQIFQPAPAVILFSDAGSNCDGVTYFTARFSFADACLVTSNPQMPSDGNGVSLDKPKTYKKCIASDFSEAVEGLADKVKKLEGELLRMDKSLSIVEVKVESQELEKFSIINRFAKFHIKARPTGADPTESNGAPNISKTYPQRYVSAHPMPKTVPEGTGCHSL